MIESLNSGYLRYLPKNDAFFAVHICSLSSMILLKRSMRCGEFVAILFSLWDGMDTLE
jgi:hypothetical protein